MIDGIHTAGLPTLEREKVKTVCTRSTKINHNLTFSCGKPFYLEHDLKLRKHTADKKSTIIEKYAVLSFQGHMV